MHAFVRLSSICERLPAPRPRASPPTQTSSRQYRRSKQVAQPADKFGLGNKPEFDRFRVARNFRGVRDPAGNQCLPHSKIRQRSGMQYRVHAVACRDFAQQPVEIFVGLKVSRRLQPPDRATAQEQLDIMSRSREPLSQFDGQFAGRLIGDKSHLIDWLAGRAAGDHYPHTRHDSLKPGSFFFVFRAQLGFFQCRPDELVCEFVIELLNLGLHLVDWVR